MLFPQVSSPLTLAPYAALLRSAVVVVVCLAGLAGLGSTAQAGCHYGFSKGYQFDSSIAKDPNGHARNFKFLGQWVYEAGEMKYVSWQPEEHCQGPNCHAEPAPEPEGSGFSSLPTSRLPVTAIGLSMFTVYSNSNVSAAIELQNLDGFRGYPPAYEYPP